MSFGKFMRKFRLIGPTILLAGLFFAVNSSFVSASDLPAEAPAKADCSHNSSSDNSLSDYFSSAFNPLISFAEKTINDFGYDIALAAIPGDVFAGTCGSVTVNCSGSSPTAAVSWDPAPPAYYYRYNANCAAPYRSQIDGSVRCVVDEYTGATFTLEVNSPSTPVYYSSQIAKPDGSWSRNTDIATTSSSYTTSSDFGLENNTAYNWGVDGRYTYPMDVYRGEETCRDGGGDTGLICTARAVFDYTFHLDYWASQGFPGSTYITLNTSAGLPVEYMLEDFRGIPAVPVPNGSFTTPTCVVAPTVSISADSTNIAYNTATTIRWSSTNATSCTVSPPNWTGTSGAQGTVI